MPYSIIPSALHVLEGTTDCVLVLDREWRFTYINGNASELLRIGQEAIGRTLQAILPNIAGTEMLDRLLEAPRTGTPVHFEYQFPENGRWFEVHTYPMPDGVQIFFRNITERKCAEAALQQSEELLRLAQSGAGAGIWDLDLESRELHLCSRGRQMHGLPGDGSLSYDMWVATLYPKDVWAVADALQRCAINGANFNVEYRTVMPDGELRWVNGLGQAVLDREGETARFVGLHLDITDKKRSEQELQRVRTELLHVGRLSTLGAMGSALAHELNQPLTAVANYVRGIRNLALLNGECVDPMLIEAAKGAEENAERAGRIVKQLREHVSKGEAERRVEPLAELIDEACALALIDAGPAGIDHKVKIGERADWVLVDRVQIQQVLLNLIRNAVEAMRGLEGRKLLEIVARRIDESKIELSVTDSGPGIDGTIMSQLFTPFVSTKENGMGVGLSICRTIVEAHGGEIGAERAPGGGTTFCFTLEAVQHG
jgi:PAS domain S-box-containing protein